MPFLFRTETDDHDSRSDKKKLERSIFFSRNFGKLAEKKKKLACARSDERYGTYATLHTAAVAFTRSGNERSVKHMKHSWLTAFGALGKPKMNLVLLSDAWLGWGFQVNFMYDPVH